MLEDSGTEFLECLSVARKWEPGKETAPATDSQSAFCAESIRYFSDRLDAAVYDNIFCSVARILYREKKGLDADNFNESLQKLHENYVFLELRRRMERLEEIALETPAFATYKGGEIDFFVKSLRGNECTYAVEAKAGRQAAPTGQAVLNDGRVDYLLLLKESSKGGVAGNVIIIPIFLFPGFRFDM